ncbi:hypothetical protein LTR48_001633 [Friedmanniomyces endolithicus]|uniref:Uncharacterized protein n=1 Tax=Rachicladosporium monterosium TaxID=1507873 RepID=A0ABR0L352_9PEZI|nr:hypothetical protein LTR48_001633 [Friedmanniomyces endolithicus]KAK5142775.1 hypothetical protein LTR32_004948 [Rachicladosporium monterosium]
MNRDGAEIVPAVLFTGHRHSHPGAVLSYGPPPPPPPPPAPAPLPQPPSHAVDPTAVNDYAALAPTLAMHNFIHHFTQHFQTYPPALIAFRNLGANFTAGSLTTEQFYVGMYQLLYRTQATELMAEFGQFRPVHWREEDLGWYHRAIEGRFDDELAAQARTREDRQTQTDETEAINAAEPAQLDGTADHDESTSSPDSSPPALHPESHTHAADHNHIGPIYPTRRAILARIEKPYIHLACGQGYPHPQDVRGHHKTCSAVRGRSRKAGDYVEWNAHESCQIGYPELKYRKVVEGYMVLERKSVEKIERAVESGLAFLRGQREEGEVGGDGVEEGVGAEVEKRVSRKGTGKRRGEGEGSTRPLPPKRQYVRAGPD